jgi:predicted phosphate transport protein (TIGR00153 family)
VNDLVKEEVYTRTPILQTLRKSPFDGLLNHFNCVKKGIKVWEKTVNFYINEDYQNFKKHLKLVDKYEQQADRVKGNIRNHLPKFIFMPIDKGDFLMLIKESDSILDAAKDVVILMDMRETKVPENLKKEIQAVIKKSIEPVDQLEKAMDMLKTILESSFGGKPREEIKKVIHKIHKLEHESDVIEKKISRHLFNEKDLDPISIIHLLKIVDRIGNIPDHAENAGDRIRAMLAK